MPARIADKMRIREGERLLLVEAPSRSVAAIDLPPVRIASRLSGEFDHILFFAKSQSRLDARFPRLAEHLAPGGKLWVAWPKGGQLGTDLNLKHVIRIGYSHGLVESVTLRIDDAWTAIKFTRPKPGKVYKNSYGRLRRRKAGASQLRP